jgi:hypothetical protein
LVTCRKSAKIQGDVENVVNDIINQFVLEVITKNQQIQRKKTRIPTAKQSLVIQLKPQQLQVQRAHHGREKRSYFKPLNALLQTLTV